ncbi:hypothetical protein D3093_33570 (plasmid) [Azospirillum argentinense]|uniref:Uncharacterized protein n=1 Tax=Azospirillum argentinense TaxID=2970906 RepID=A0A4D8PQD6_9PROT|nr:hypothetical protein D3093_33570 [Azospirillum argentinense]
MRWAPKHPANIGKGVSDHTVTFGRPTFWSWAPEHRTQIGKAVSRQWVAIGRPTFRSGRPLGA